MLLFLLKGCSFILSILPSSVTVCSEVPYHFPIGMLKVITLKGLKPLLLVLCCGAWGLLSYLLNLQVVTLLSFQIRNSDFALFLILQYFYLFLFELFLSIEPFFSTFGDVRKLSSEVRGTRISNSNQEYMWRI